MIDATCDIFVVANSKFKPTQLVDKNTFSVKINRIELKFEAKCLQRKEEEKKANLKIDISIRSECERM